MNFNGMEEPSSSSKTRDGDSEFEEMWSELHSLKKLYGILQKNSANTPNGDNTHETLDEKSRLLLKKLLDNATHQALQSQTKIVFSSPSGTHSSEPKINSEDGLQKEMIVPEKVQECHAAPVHKDQHKLTCPKVSSGPDRTQAAKSGRLPVAKSQISQKTSPLLELKRQTSLKSTKSSNEKLQHQIDRGNRVRDHLSSKLRPTATKSITHIPPNHVVNPTVQTRTRQVDGGDLPAVVPVPTQKRARVEAKATSQTCIDGRVDRELTHSKRAELVAGRVRKPVSRIGSLNNRTATKSTAKIDQGKERTDKMKKNSSRETSSCASNKGRVIEPPRKPPPIRTKSYESASRTTSSSSGTYVASLPRRLPARAVPTRRQPRKMEAGPLRRKAVVGENKEGKLARFKNKLAIIFHHHHHHHHHIHDGPVGNVDNGGTQQHRTPWKYLRGVLCRKSDGACAKHAKAVARAPARQGQIGYFHALLEGLVRHVWGMRRRRKVAENRIGPAKKRHWWQRLRRRGGVTVANRKKPRLRIGFTRMNSRTRKKLG